MTIRQMLVISASAFSLLTLPCNAGPCSQDINRVQTDMDAKLKAIVAAGPSEKQGTGAQMHRQPTPRLIAEAESKTGDLPQSTIEKVKDAMDRARKADAAGDLPTCEGALSDVRRIISAK